MIQDAIGSFEIYLLSEKRLSSNTVSSYIGDLHQLEKFLLKKKIILLSKVDVDILKKYLKYLKLTLKMSARSLARKVSTIKSFYNFAARRLGADNLGLLLIFPKQHKRLPKFLSEEEIEHLLSFAAKDSTDLGIRNRTMLVLLYVTGMRISELVNLRISNIQFDDGMITVTGKGDKQRIVPLSIEVLNLIRLDYLEGVYERLLGDKFSTTDYLFPTIYAKKVKCITRQSFWLLLKQMAKKAGISRDLSPHKLRHSLATHLLRKGANLRLLQMLLGHERLSTVQIYTHVDMDYLRGIYDKRHPRS